MTGYTARGLSHHNQSGTRLKMENIVKIVMALLIMMTMVVAEEELEVVVREMMMEMKMMKWDLRSTKEELLIQIDAKDNSIYELERELSSLKNPYQTFACAGHYSVLSTTRQAISYSNLLYSSSNVAGALTILGTNRHQQSFLIHNNLYTDKQSDRMQFYRYRYWAKSMVSKTL